MWECFSDAAFMFDVAFRLLPTFVTYLCLTYLLKYASDWF